MSTALGKSVRAVRLFASDESGCWGQKRKGTGKERIDGWLDCLELWGAFASSRLRGICSCQSPAKDQLDLSALLATDGERLGSAETRDPGPSLTVSYRRHWMTWLIRMILAGTNDAFLSFFYTAEEALWLCCLCMGSYLADFSRCVSCHHNRKQINIQLQLLQQPREYFLYEEKQSLCCFCQTSSFQIRCSSGKWF